MAKSKKITCNVPLNRVEGDLEIKAELTDRTVTDAWSSGTMFRGFENILVGRGALDSLVITPRICGLCSVCHLKAAARALDMITGAKVPGAAIRARNIVMLAEDIQSDVRHGFLMFAPDFANAGYKDHPLHQEAVARYEPFRGESAVEVIRQSKLLLELIAIIGGQWPHTSFIVPGGIVSMPTAGDLLQCRQLLGQYRHWYEERVLGCAIERWREVKTLGKLEAWVEENEAQRESEVGFFVRFARAAGLHTYGKGHGNFLSYGALDLPDDTEVVSLGQGTQLVPAGFAEGTRVGWFEQQKIAEHVGHSWFEDTGVPLHPGEGRTKPYASGQEGEKYSWAKAPRYDGRPAETGPLAEAVISQQPLFTDLVANEGPSAFSRELARLVRATLAIPALETWLDELAANGKAKYYSHPGEVPDGEGFGLTEAARGALGHWVRIEDGKIAHYQIITPTAWNASPRDDNGVRGPWEEALVGAPVKDVDNPVELGHVVRSFDSCMVCCVHAFSRGKSRGRLKL